MERKSLKINQETRLKIEVVSGDLRITGWEQDEIKAKTNGNSLEMTSD